MQSQKSSTSAIKWFGQLLILSALVFFGTTAFKNLEETPLSDSKIGRLTEDVRKNEVLAWQLNHNYDHYGAGSIIRADPQNPQFLILASNKTFVAFDANEKREGRWEVSYSDNIITFFCEEINGEKIPEAMTYQFIVKDYVNGTLKLAWQGRHGFVDMIYTPVSRTVRGETNLPTL